MRRDSQRAQMLARPRRWRTVIAAAAAALLTVTCSGSTPTSISPDGALRVLFVGNSLSRGNELPRMVKALADSAGGRRIHVGEVIFGGVSLEDHWSIGTALDSIATRRWDVVVLQQGPSSLDASRANLIEWTGHFAARIRAAGGQPALYQVWPEDVRFHVFDRVLDSYRLAAESVNGELLPAGAAWIAAWQLDSSLPLYGPDGFHPSPMGTYLAALVVYEQIFASPPPATPVPPEAQPVADVLRRTAHETVQAIAR